MTRSLAALILLMMTVGALAQTPPAGEPLPLQPPRAAPSQSIVPPPAPVQVAPLPPPVGAAPAPVPAPTTQPTIAPTQTLPTVPTPVDIVRDARSLGRSSADNEIDEVTLVAVPVAISAVRGRIEQVTDIMRAGFAELLHQVGRAGLVVNGAPMTVYLQIGDQDFSAELMIPVVEIPNPPPQGLRTGRSPAGKAVRIVHAGAYDTLDESYDQLSTFVEDRDIPVREIVIERYMNDPNTTASTDLLTEIYVLMR